MDIERVTIGGVDFVPEDRARDEELRLLRTRTELQRAAIEDYVAKLDDVRDAVGLEIVVDGKRYETREKPAAPPDDPTYKAAALMTGHAEPRRRGRLSVLTGFWLVVIGLVVGASAVPFNAETPTLVETKVVEVPAPAQAYSTQRFAWDPEPGAGGYVLGFYRMPGMVEQARFEAAEATLEVSLPPGEYNWYVWPVFRGTQAGKAIVASTVTVS